MKKIDKDQLLRVNLSRRVASSKKNKDYRSGKTVIQEKKSTNK